MWSNIPNVKCVNPSGPIGTKPGESKTGLTVDESFKRFPRVQCKIKYINFNLLREIFANYYYKFKDE